MSLFRIFSQAEISVPGSGGGSNISPGEQRDLVLHGDGQWRSMVPEWEANPVIRVIGASQVIYSAGSVVQYEGELYESKEYHIATSIFDLTKWNVLTTFRYETVRGNAITTGVKLVTAVPNTVYECIPHTLADPNAAPPTTLTSDAYTITLPLNPHDGTRVRVSDPSGTFDEINCTVQTPVTVPAGDRSRIVGASLFIPDDEKLADITSTILNKEFSINEFLYDETTNSWMLSILNSARDLDDAYNFFKNGPSVVSVDAADGQTGGALIWNMSNSQDMSYNLTENTTDFLINKVRAGVVERVVRVNGDGQIDLSPPSNQKFIVETLGNTGDIDLQSSGGNISLNSQTSNSKVSLQHAGVDIIAVTATGQVNIIPTLNVPFNVTTSGTADILLTQTAIGATGDIVLQNIGTGSVKIKDGNNDVIEVDSNGNLNCTTQTGLDMILDIGGQFKLKNTGGTPTNVIEMNDDGRLQLTPTNGQNAEITVVPLDGGAIGHIELQCITTNLTLSEIRLQDTTASAVVKVKSDGNYELRPRGAGIAAVLLNATGNNFVVVDGINPIVANQLLAVNQVGTVVITPKNNQNATIYTSGTGGTTITHDELGTGFQVMRDAGAQGGGGGGAPFTLFQTTKEGDIAVTPISGQNATIYTSGTGGTTITHDELGTGFQVMRDPGAVGGAGLLASAALISTTGTGSVSLSPISGQKCIITHDTGADSAFQVIINGTTTPLIATDNNGAVSIRPKNGQKIIIEHDNTTNSGFQVTRDGTADALIETSNLGDVFLTPRDGQKCVISYDNSGGSAFQVFRDNTTLPIIETTNVGAVTVTPTDGQKYILACGTAVNSAFQVNTGTDTIISVDNAGAVALTAIDGETVTITHGDAVGSGFNIVHDTIPHGAGVASSIFQTTNAGAVIINPVTTFSLQNDGDDLIVAGAGGKISLTPQNNNDILSVLEDGNFEVQLNGDGDFVVNINTNDDMFLILNTGEIQMKKSGGTENMFQTHATGGVSLKAQGDNIRLHARDTGSVLISDGTGAGIGNTILESTTTGAITITPTDTKKAIIKHGAGLLSGFQVIHDTIPHGAGVETILLQTTPAGLVNITPVAGQKFTTTTSGAGSGVDIITGVGAFDVQSVGVGGTVSMATTDGDISFTSTTGDSHLATSSGRSLYSFNDNTDTDGFYDHATPLNFDDYHHNIKFYNSNVTPTTGRVKMALVTHATADSTLDFVNDSGSWRIGRVAGVDDSFSVINDSGINAFSILTAGTQTTINKLTIIDNDADDVIGGILQLQHTRKDEGGTDQHTQSADSLGLLNFSGETADDGGTTAIGSTIESKATENWSAGNVGSNLLFSTVSATTAVLAARMTIGNTTILHNDSNSAAGPELIMQKTRSINDGDEDVQNDDILGKLSFAGESIIAGGGILSSSLISVTATADWANNSTPSKIEIFQTPTGNTPINRLTIDQEIKCGGVTGGFVVPSITGTLRDDVGFPTSEGSTLYNSTTDRLNIFSSAANGGWESIISYSSVVHDTAQLTAKKNSINIIKVGVGDTGGFITLPAVTADDDGCRVRVVDGIGNFENKVVAVLREGTTSTIGDGTTTHLLRRNFGIWEFEYVNETDNWVIITKPKNITVELTSVAALPWDCAYSPSIKVTVTTGLTFAQPTNIKDGYMYTLVLTQGDPNVQLGAGDFTGFNFVGNTVGDSLANTKDIYMFMGFDNELIEMSRRTQV